MKRSLIMILILALICFNMTHICGCSNNAQTYGAVGGVSGLIVGGIVGGVGGAIALGAIGGGAGYVIGNEQDKH